MVVANMGTKQATSFKAFLPQSADALLCDPVQKGVILTVLKKLHRIMVEAIEDFFIAQDIHVFDPHVGETCCQVRAYQLLTLFKNRSSIFKNRASVQRYIGQLNAQQLWLEKQFLSESQQQKSQKDRKSLSVFLIDCECDFAIPRWELAYLMSAKLLSKYCYFNEVGMTGIKIKTLSQDWQISMRLAHNLIRVAQRYLSEASCQFLKDLCQQAPSLSCYKQVISSLEKRDDDHRAVLPCFLGMKILFEHMKFARQPILLQAERRTSKHLDTISLLFLYDDHEGRYKLTSSLTQDPALPCFVVHGVTMYEGLTRCPRESREAYVKRLTSVGIEKLVLSAMASHIQFVGKKLHAFRDLPMGMNVNVSSPFGALHEEFFSLRAFAKEEGCTIEHAKLLVVRHVYCDTLGNQAEASAFLHQMMRGVNVNVIKEDKLRAG